MSQAVTLADATTKQYHTFKVAGVPTDPTAVTTVDLVQTDGTVAVEGLSPVSEAGTGRYSVTITVNGVLTQPGFYRPVYRDVEFVGFLDPIDVSGSVFTLTLDIAQIESDGGWEMVGGISRHSNKELDISENFAEKPETFFFEKNYYAYTTSDFDYKTEIPVCNKYIFPSKYVWAANPTHTGLLPYFRQFAEVGVDVPVHSINTNLTYGGFSSLVHNTLSGLSAFQISTSGQYVYTDEYAVVYDFWNDSHRGQLNNIVESYRVATNSGVDFVVYINYEDFNTQLRNNPDDSPNWMLDTETYGWFGVEPWQQWKWDMGMHAHAQSGVLTTSYVETGKPWYIEGYPELRRLDVGPATVISGAIYEDDEWHSGEIWNYINFVRAAGQSTILAYTFDRSCYAWEATLGKAIALCTDSAFSPGEANYSILQNYTDDLYTKYNLGNALGPPYKEGDTIKRDFSGGWVIIEDNGDIDEGSEYVYETYKPDPPIIRFALPLGYNSMVNDDRRYSTISDSTISSLAGTADYYTVHEDVAQDSEFPLLKAALVSNNNSIKVGTTLYYTDWPEVRWHAEYVSGLDTYGSYIYMTISGTSDPLSVNYRLMWYKTLNDINVDYFIIPELPYAHKSWLKSAFPTKGMIMKTTTNHSHMLVEGESFNTVSGLLSAGRYVWTDDLGQAAYLECGYWPYGVDLGEAL